MLTALARLVRFPEYFAPPPNQYAHQEPNIMYAPPGHGAPPSAHVPLVYGEPVRKILACSR
jgi:hypothetical protein